MAQQNFWEDLYDTLSGLFGGVEAAVLGNTQQIQHEEHVSGSDRGIHSSSSDPQLANLGHNHNFSRMGGLAVARIIYSMPLVHSYRVQVDGLGDMPACSVTETGTTPFSVHNTSTFPVHSSVLVWVPEDVHCAYIIGVVPDKNEDGERVFSDNLFQGSGVGFMREEYYKGLFGLVSSDGEMVDFSNNRVLDGLGSEWGRIAEMGGGCLVDNFVSFLRADECCGLWCYYMDRLAKLSGHNLDIHTAISELTVRSDTGEGIYTFGSTAYPWEAMGSLTPGTKLLREEADEDVIFNKHVGKLEPVEDNQTPFYRLEEFRGYLGQAFMRQVRIPGYETGLVTTSDTKLLPGVFREQIGMDGSWGVESAHSVSIVKRAIIPAARRIRTVEDLTGDTAENYNFSGLDPDGVPHRVKAISGSGLKDGHIQEALGLSDLTAYLFNWKGTHPFYYHSKDFSLPPINAANADVTMIQAPIRFKDLLQKSWLSAPNPRAQAIDHRYDTADYYENTSGFFLLPQGGVVIRDGFGGEIRMVGGSIQISAPGDVWLQPGRNLNVLAGDDVNVRAKNSIDFYATDKDIRLKAEHNMEFLAANGGDGRMLFENKADNNSQQRDDASDGEDMVGETITGSGFIFKADKSEFITAVAGIYLRTGGGTEDDKIRGGPIVLDADKGDKDVTVIGRSVTMHMTSALRHTFPVTGKKDVSNVFHPKGVLLHSSAVIDGNLYVMEGGITMGPGHIAMRDGQIGSGSLNNNGLVGQYAGNSLITLENNLAEAKANLATTLENGENMYEDGVRKIYYDKKWQVGHGSFQVWSSFSPRNDRQMNTDQPFMFAQNYWQQIAMATNSVPSVWSENVIKYLGKEYMPYPGKLAWVGETAEDRFLESVGHGGGYEAPKSWLTYKTSLHDSVTGIDRNAGNIYEDFIELPEIVPATADNVYPITSISRN